MWKEPDDNNLALSFQEKDGCTDVWEMICTVRRLSTPPAIYLCVLRVWCYHTCLGGA